MCFVNLVFLFYTSLISNFEAKEFGVYVDGGKVEFSMIGKFTS